MKHPLAVDLVEFVDEQPADKRMILAHIVACEPCRRGVINVIQTNDAYPDLFANPADAALRGSALSVAPPTTTPAKVTAWAAPSGYNAEQSSAWARGWNDALAASVASSAPTPPTERVDDLVLAFYNGVPWEQLTDEQRDRFNRYQDARAGAGSAPKEPQ